MTITSEKPNPQPLTADHSVHLHSASANQLTTEWSQWALRYRSCSPHAGEWGNSAVHDPAVQQMMHRWSHLLFRWKYEAIFLWFQVTDGIPGSVAQRAFIIRITLIDSTTCTRAALYGTCKAGFNTFISVYSIWYSTSWNFLFNADWDSVSCFG